MIRRKRFNPPVCDDLGPFFHSIEEDREVTFLEYAECSEKERAAVYRWEEVRDIFQGVCLLLNWDPAHCDATKEEVRKQLLVWAEELTPGQRYTVDDRHMRSHEDNLRGFHRAGCGKNRGRGCVGRGAVLRRPQVSW